MTRARHCRASAYVAIALLLAMFAAVQCTTSPTPAAPASKPAESAKTGAKGETAQPGTKTEPAKAQAQPSPASEPKPGGTISLGYEVEPESIDPHVGERQQLPALIAPVYDTLVYKDSKGDFTPGLATSWTISPDGLSYTFKLRSGVKFHDGTPFNAAAAKFNFDRIMDPATESRWAKQIIGPFSSAEVVDDLTLKVNFKEPYGPFLQSLAQPFIGMVSPAAVQKWGKQYSAHQVGTGPFIFKEYVAKDHITLERNPDYKWAPSVFNNQGPPYVDSIVFKFIPESAARRGTVETGETNMIHALEPRDVGPIKSNQNLKVYVNSKPSRSRHYTMNVTKAPTNELEVRQALILAVNREQVVKTLFDDVYLPANAVLGPGSLFFDKSLEAKYAAQNAFDLAKAKALLDKAGWKMGASGIREKDGKPLKIDIATASFKEVHELIKAQLKELGVDVEIKLTAAPAFFASCGKGEVNLCFLGGEAAPDPALHMGGFFSSKGQYNWSMNSDPALDKLISDGATLTESDKRQKAYSDAASLIMDKALILPVFYPQDVYVARSEVQGLHFNFMADPIFSDVYIKK